MENENRKIIFYDGDCGFCNKSVQFILNHGKDIRIHFSALQSPFAKRFFAQNGLPKPNLSTFYFWDNRMYSKSSGALRVLNYVKLPYSLGKIAWIIPRFLRDCAYDGIAKRRHKLANGFCALPTAEDRLRFLRE
jgi:predicted DCC family thiol-disulfide oxidoreductase YuxK